MILGNGWRIQIRVFRGGDQAESIVGGEVTKSNTNVFIAATITHQNSFPESPLHSNSSDVWSNSSYRNMRELRVRFESLC